jgi:hypothetical protein
MEAARRDLSAQFLPLGDSDKCSVFEFAGWVEFIGQMLLRVGGGRLREIIRATQFVS